MSASLTSPSIVTVEHQFAGVSDATFKGREDSRAWFRCWDQLALIRTLQENWDDAGALPVSTDISKSADDILEQLRERGLEPPTRILAGPNGSIVFEWQQPGVNIEIEIETQYIAEWMYTPKGGPVRHWTEEFVPTPQNNTDAI